MNRWYRMMASLLVSLWIIASVTSLSRISKAFLVVTGAGNTLTTHSCKHLNPKNTCLGNSALTGWTIVLDPGHGKDPRNGNGTGRSNTGAPGVNGMWEDLNNLAIAQRLESLLASEGAHVYLTRGEYNPGLPGLQGLHNRVVLAERVHANLFISIHQDWNASGRARGAETFYYRDDSRPLAIMVQRQLVTMTGLKDRGVQRGEFYVIKHTTMPAVLVEGGFLSNPMEAKLISTSAFHQKEAEALNRAVLEYVQSSPSPMRSWLQWWPWRRRQ